MFAWIVMIIVAMIIIIFLSYLHPVLGVGGGILVFLCLITSCFPSESENLIKDTKTNYEQLFEIANKSLINNGGVSETLYNQMKVHNLETEKIKEDRKTKRLDFKKKDYIFDLSQYPILKEELTTEPNTEAATNTTVIEDESTSEAQTEETTATNDKQFIEIDGQRYELVPAEE